MIRPFFRDMYHTRQTGGVVLLGFFRLTFHSRLKKNKEIWGI